MGLPGIWLMDDRGRAHRGSGFGRLRVLGLRTAGSQEGEDDNHGDDRENATKSQFNLRPRMFSRSTIERNMLNRRDAGIAGDCQNQFSAVFPASPAPLR
jgi:hypothetical protein